MLRSTDRIITSHAGALEQPVALRQFIKARDERQPYDEQAFDAQLHLAVTDVVKKQVESGLDSINDGEFGKQNFTSYVGARISGYEPKVVDPAKAPPPFASVARDANDFRPYYDRR